MAPRGLRNEYARQRAGHPAAEAERAEPRAHPARGGAELLALQRRRRRVVGDPAEPAVRDTHRDRKNHDEIKQSIEEMPVMRGEEGGPSVQLLVQALISNRSVAAS